MVAPLTILTARGIETLVDWSRRLAAPTVATGRAALAIGIACASAILVFLPWRAATKYYQYRGMSAAVSPLAQTESLRGALVFVRGAAQGMPFSRYSAAAVFNPPTLEDPGTIFVRDLDDASKRRLECAFPGRVVLGIDTSALPGGRVVVTDEPRATVCRGTLAAQGGAQ
jgi:hypothetical protein